MCQACLHLQEERIRRDRAVFKVDYPKIILFFWYITLLRFVFVFQGIWILRPSVRMAIVEWIMLIHFIGQLCLRLNESTNMWAQCQALRLTKHWSVRVLVKVYSRHAAQCQYRRQKNWKTRRPRMMRSWTLFSYPLSFMDFTNWFNSNRRYW